MTIIRDEPTAVEGAPLAAALARFQSEMPTVSKTKTARVPTKDGGSYAYTYADLADVTEAAMPLLTAQGLSFATVPRYTEHGYELVGVLLHESGESMEGALPIHGSSAQQLGSAITYARRYLLGCMTGVVTDDDDDGRTAAQPAKKAAAKKAAPQKSAAAARTPGGATVDQIRMLAILMSELGMTEKEAALDYVAGVIGRRVQSRNDLTGAEASRVIDALQTRGVEALPPPAPPADPWATEASTPPAAKDADGSAGPPGPADPGEAYRADVADAARRQSAAEEPVPVAPPLPPPSVARVTPATVERIRRQAKKQLGDVATEAEELALLSAIVGHPVESVEALTRPEGQTAAIAFGRFDDGSLKWEFDLSDEAAVPRVIIHDVNVVVGGEGR